MPVDRPREGGETPQPSRGLFDRPSQAQPPPADHDPTAMPVDKDGQPYHSAGYRRWYRDHSTEHPHAPAPRDSTPMAAMERRGPDAPIAGVLTKPADSVLKDAERVWEGMSGKEGPADRVGWQELRLRNAKVTTILHAEAHAAAAMREQEMDEAVLYLSERPCPYDRRLPEGTVDYDPDQARS